MSDLELEQMLMELEQKLITIIDKKNAEIERLRTEKDMLEIDIMCVTDDVGVSTVRDVIFEVRALRRERRLVGNQAYVAAMEHARDVIQERDRLRAELAEWCCPGCFSTAWDPKNKFCYKCKPAGPLRAAGGVGGDMVDNAVNEEGEQ